MFEAACPLRVAVSCLFHFWQAGEKNKRRCHCCCCTTSLGPFYYCLTKPAQSAMLYGCGRGGGGESCIWFWWFKWKSSFWLFFKKKCLVIRYREITMPKELISSASVGKEAGSMLGLQRSNSAGDWLSRGMQEEHFRWAHGMYVKCHLFLKSFIN